MTSSKLSRYFTARQAHRSIDDRLKSFAQPLLDTANDLQALGSDVYGNHFEIKYRKLDTSSIGLNVSYADINGDTHFVSERSTPNETNEQTIDLRKIKAFVEPTESITFIISIDTNNGIVGLVARDDLPRLKDASMMDMVKDHWRKSLRSEPLKEKTLLESMQYALEYWADGCLGDRVKQDKAFALPGLKNV